MDETSPCIRLLVVGDSGVGKTSFVHALCHREVPKDPYGTVGCNIDVKLHDYNGQEWEVELWDVGGSPSHRLCRSIFYDSIHGIILVHDLTNRKSYSNLNKWINEIVPMLSDDNLTDSESEVPITRTSRLSAASTDFIDLEEFVGDAGLVPMVIVGTKRDEINDADLQRAHDASSIVVSTQTINDFNPTSATSRQFGKFLDSCIQRRASRNSFSTHRGVGIGYPSGPITRNYSASHLSSSHLAPGMDHLMQTRPGHSGPYERRRRTGGAESPNPRGAMYDH